MLGTQEKDVFPNYREQSYHPVRETDKGSKCSHVVTTPAELSDGSGTQWCSPSGALLEGMLWEHGGRVPYQNGVSDPG